MAEIVLYDKAQEEIARTATAEAIRAKGGTSAPISWDTTTGFKTAVDAIPTGGGGGEIKLTATDGTGNFQNFELPSGEVTVILDMLGLAKPIPAVRNLKHEETTPLNFKILNCENSTATSDFIRQCQYIGNIDFAGGIHLAEYWRFIYGSQTKLNEITVTGIYLDKVKENSFNAPFTISGPTSTWDGVTVMWEGELLTSQSGGFNTSALTPKSVKSLVRHLHDYSGGDAHTLTLPERLKAYLDTADIEYATSRGWTIA